MLANSWVNSDWLQHKHSGSQTGKLYVNTCTVYAIQIDIGHLDRLTKGGVKCRTHITLVSQVRFLIRAKQ